MTTAPSCASPLEVVSTLLSRLGFEFSVEEAGALTGPVLNITTPQQELLIGRDGETLEDLQFLVNRLLQLQDSQAPKVHLDVNRYREERNRRLLDEVSGYAQLVRETGEPFHLEPMPAYERRLIHRAYEGDPEVTTWSQDDDARIKRITLLRRNG